MHQVRNYRLPLGLFFVTALVLAFSLACASAEPTATPMQPATPAAPVAPTAIPGSAPATPVPSGQTPVSSQPTATRTLPTATPVLSGTQPRQGGTLRYASNFDVDTLDGHLNIDSTVQPILYALYNNIVELGPGGIILPDLAETWDFSPDGKTVTFHLRKGAKFQDGTPFNAQAIKWNIDRILDPALGSAQRSVISGAVDSVTVLDENTVVFQLKNPFRPFLATLTERPGYVLSPTATGKPGANMATNPVTTGPFKLASWQIGGNLTVTRNNDYWDKGKPYLDSIVFQNVPDSTVQVAMLRTGESDIIINVRAADAKLMKSNSKLKILEVEGRVYTLNLNVQQAPFNNKALRQAIAYSINRKQIIDVYYEGAARPAYTPEPPVNFTYNSDLKPYEYDLAKAKAKLAEAGYPNGVTVPMWCPSTASELLRCEMFQAQFKEAGINVDFHQKPMSDWWASFTRSYKGERILFGHWYWSPRGDPHQSLQRLFHSKGASNVSDYFNPEVDKLIEDAAAIYDTAKAKVLYDQLQKIVTEDAPFVYYAYPTEFEAMAANVENVVWRPDMRLRVRNLWFSK